MLRSQATRLAVIVPAHRPADSLAGWVRDIIAKDLAPVVVVDDGSGSDFADFFAQIAALPGVEVLHHAAHLGRGAAVRTGLNYALCAWPDLTGVVRIDPERRPASEDIARFAASLRAHPESLIVGQGDSVVRVLTGSGSDAGICGIPASFAARVLQLEANGEEFDFEMLVEARRACVPITELLTSRSAQAPGFNPILESTRFYFLLLRFAVAGLLTALADNLVFSSALHHGASLFLSLALGRAAGAVLNYPAVRTLVFRSRRPHSTALPRYLALVIASGAASYAGIRLLAGTLGIASLPAKLVVETALFLVNFAVERLLVFDGERTSIRERKRAIPFTPVIAAVFLSAVAVEVHGFLTAKLFEQDVWEPIGVARFLKYIGMFLGIAFPLLAMAPWTFPAAIVGLTAVGTTFAIGPLALLAVVFYLISSCALGSLLLGRKHDDSPESQLFSILLGASVWIFLFTLAARVPLNYPAVWAGLLAIPVALDWRGAWRRLWNWWSLVSGAELRLVPERLAFAALVFVLLAQWFVALKPESSADGLAMHLAIPANIAMHHALTYQPSRIIWSVMPMGADLSYAVVYLFGGEYAAHLLDFSLLLIIEALLYFVIRRWICRAAAFWLLALFASTPLVQLVTGSLFVENLLASMILGMAAALWRFAETGERRFFFLSAALGGTAMATKFGALAFVAFTLPFLVSEAARHWKSLGPRPAAACGLAVFLLLGTGLPPYAIAYFKTGNPLFPFLYDKIPSPLIPRDAGIEDARFKRPLTWDTPYDLTFRTHLTYEGRNGSFGFQYLAFAPLGVAALLVARRRRIALSAVVIALGAAAIVMGTQPNARYVYACLPLLSVPFAALLAWSAGTRWLYRGLLVFVAVCFALNMRFMPSASYYHRDFCLRLPFSRAERNRYRSYAAPVRDVIDDFNRRHATSAVLMGSESAIAGLDGDIYENHWHQIRNYWRIREMKTVADMVRLMQSWNVEYFISPKPDNTDVVQPLQFKEMLEQCTQPLYEQGGEYLARLEPDCRHVRVAVLVHRGAYDDFDPALLYRGEWNHDRNFAEPDQHTISFTDAPGAEVEMDFEGRAFTYEYTKAVNRGIASVTVDGVDQAAVDLYSADTQWQSQTRFCCFAPGRHVVVIRVSGKADPRSKGKFIDLDSFSVE